MATVREKDSGLQLDVDVGESVADATTLELVLRHQPTGRRVVLTGSLVGTQVVRATTTVASVPLDGSWQVQAHVVQPTKDRRSTIGTLTAEEAL